MSRYAALLCPLFATAFLVTCLGACQTPRYKEFEAIHGGMSKGEVLAKVGGPNRTQRWHGRDRWEYTLIGHPEGDIVREIHFEDGKSTYVGPAIKPAITADEQDRINLLSNHRAEETEAQARDGVTIQTFRPVDDADASSAKPTTKK